MVVVWWLGGGRRGVAPTPGRYTEAGGGVDGGVDPTVLCAPTIEPTGGESRDARRAPPHRKIVRGSVHGIGPPPPFLLFLFHVCRLCLRRRRDDGGDSSSADGVADGTKRRDVCARVVCAGFHVT